LHTESILKCLEVLIQRVQCPRRQAPLAEVAHETSKVGDNEIGP
jgi:hypothetical protein